MEIFCEEKYFNFPADVEFQLNGVDKGEFVGTSPNLLEPIGTPPRQDEQEWMLLNEEIFKTVALHKEVDDQEPCFDQVLPQFQELTQICVYEVSQESQFYVLSELTPQYYSVPHCDMLLHSEAQQREFDHQDQFTGNSSKVPVPNRPPSGKAVFKNKNKPCKPIADHCVFCFNNGESESTFKSHLVKNSRGHVTCPRLFRYVCPICGQTGPDAHTVKYCKYKKIVTMEDVNRMGNRRRYYKL